MQIKRILKLNLYVCVIQYFKEHYHWILAYNIFATCLATYVLPVIIKFEGGPARADAITGDILSKKPLADKV